MNELIQYMENTTAVVGDMTWSLFAHDAQCCHYVQHVRAVSSNRHSQNID